MWAASIELRMTLPSVPPTAGSTARSGWGIIPSTLRPAESTPAMSLTG